MQNLTPMLWLGMTLAAAGAADSQAVVRFSNNDRLAGTLDSLTADLLVWKSPLLEKPTPFFLKNVMDLALPTVLPEDLAKHEATIKLTNGDTVCGQLASVTDDAVALDTWFAGRLNFNRLMVAGLKIAEKSTFVYRGPTGLDGWIQAADKPAWSFNRAAFRSNSAGTIARNVLPENECSIAFDIAWRADEIGLKVVFFGDDPAAENSSSGYEMAFQRGSIYLRNCKTQSFLGGTNAQVLMENDKAHIEIRASLKSGKICLLINDRMLEAWTDPDAAKGKFGTALQFVSQTASQLRVSGIAIAQWDGVMDRLPEPRIGLMRQARMLQPDDQPAPPVAPEKPKEGRMELANGDSLDGEVSSITDGMISVKTPLGDVKFPVSRLRTVALKKSDLERCKRRNGDIRAWFADGSSIVFKLDAVAADVLTGSSQNFGTANFKLTAFNRIEFNIHDPELEDKRTPGDW